MIEFSFHRVALGVATAFALASCTTVDRAASTPAGASPASAKASSASTARAQAARPGADYARLAREAMQRDFRTRGQASVDRLRQDDVQKACTEHPGDLAKQDAEKLQAENLKTIRYPADGQYLGDWREGEKVAQTGVGKQWSDDPKAPAGGNCYACHELAKHELSFGTIGPSLYHYGKVRGTGEDVLRYTWGRLWSPQAFTACSNMPRFGHAGILTEQQLKHVMALLLDPKSPVNQ